MGAITIKAHTLEQALASIKQDRYERIWAIMLHHTWIPNTAQDNGLSTVQGVQRAHMNAGAQDGILANWYYSNIGLLYNGRPLHYANWAHRGSNHTVGSVDPALEARTATGCGATTTASASRPLKLRDRAR